MLTQQWLCSLSILLYLGGFVQCSICHYGRRVQCCKGYVLDDSVPSDRLVCKPICSPACTNSTCKRPGVCICNPGFRADPYNDRNCLPICTSGCLNGACIAPDTCECNYGYVKKEGVCTPVCTEPCRNGTCVSPENCLCNTGYRQSDENTCEPYCSRGCNAGRCMAPEVCACDPGWRQVAPNTCDPECSPSCFNGRCVAPNKCECFDGYQLTFPRDFYTCLPPTTTSTTTEIYSTTHINTMESDATTMDDPETDNFETESSNSSDVFVTGIPFTETPITNTKGVSEIWVYTTIGLVLLIVATLVLIVILLRRTLLAYIKGGSYVVEDHQPRSTQDSFNVTFSSILQKQ